MKLISFRIHNFKGFNDSGLLRFSDGFNFVVGQNNSAKSALLEALGMQFQPHSHRSPKTKPKLSSALPVMSSVTFELAATGQEVRDALFTIGGRLYVHLPKGIPGLDEKAGRET